MTHATASVLKMVDTFTKKQLFVLQMDLEFTHCQCHTTTCQ